MLARTLGHAAAILSLAVLAACATAPRLERYTAMPAGSTYTQVNLDTGSFGNGRSEVSGTIVAREWQGQQVVGFQGPQGMLVLKPSGEWLAQLAADGRTMVSWDPPLNWEYPIEVGKSWTKQYTVRLHAQNRTVPYESRQTVEAYEEVTVPAGTFKAFKVRTVTTLGDDNVIWFSPEHGMFVKAMLRRTDKHMQGPGTREQVLTSVRKAY